MPAPISRNTVSYTGATVERRYPFVHAAGVPPVFVPVAAFCALAGGRA